MANLSAKFEVSVHIGYEDMQGNAKMQKNEWFEILKGHSRSSEIAPFDRAHTSSYWLSIYVRIFTIFEIQRDIGRKSPIYTPRVFCVPRWR